MTRTQDILQRMVKLMRLGKFDSPMDAYDQAVEDHDQEYSKKHSYIINPTYCSHNIKP